jgi:hypothetical protein
MPIQATKYEWLWAESYGGATHTATGTVSFASQAVFAQASISTIQTTHTPGSPSASTVINAQIKSYTMVGHRQETCAKLQGGWIGC